LIARIANGVIRDGVKPAFLLGKAENVIVNPVFQAESYRPVLGCFRHQFFFVFDKSRTALVQGLCQPVRNAVFDFQD
jgi:hypothetical protein